MYYNVYGLQYMIIIRLKSLEIFCRLQQTDSGQIQFKHILDRLSLDRFKTTTLFLKQERLKTTIYDHNQTKILRNILQTTIDRFWTDLAQTDSRLQHLFQTTPTQDYYDLGGFFKSMTRDELCEVSSRNLEGKTQVKL